MYSIIRNSNKFLCKYNLIRNNVLYCAYASVSNEKYTDEVKKKLLSVINSDNGLKQLNRVLSNSRIAELEKWKRDNGNFSNFEQVLQLKGFGTKTLEKCYNYFSNETGDCNTDSTESLAKEQLTNGLQPKTNSSSLKFRIKPNLVTDKAKSIKSYASIHLDTNALTWARFEVLTTQSDSEVPNSVVSGVKVTDWFYNRIVSQKVHICDLHNELSNIIKKIPETDVYIHEELPSKSHRNNIGPKQIAEIIQSEQSIAIMLTLLTARHVDADENFYFFGRLLMARLYNLLINGETVSTVKLVNDLLDSARKSNEILQIFDTNEQNEESKENVFKSFTIKFDDGVIHSYKKAVKIDQEFMGKALLNGLTFLRLAIMQCPKSLAILKVKGVSKNS